MHDLIGNELNIGDVVTGSPRGSYRIAGIYLVAGLSDKTIRLICIRLNHPSFKTWDFLRIKKGNHNPIAPVIKYPLEYLPFEWQTLIRQEQQTL